MQGVHDHVEISILTESVKDTEIYRSMVMDAGEIQKMIKKEEASHSSSNVCNFHYYSFLIFRVVRHLFKDSISYRKSCGQ